MKKVKILVAFLLLIALTLLGLFACSDKPAKTEVGELTVTADENGCSCLEVAAGQDVSGLAVKLVNVAALDRDASRDAYKILDAPGGYVGKFDTSAMSEAWHLRHTSTAVYLNPITPFVLVIR